MLVLMIALLPLRGWVGDAMATGMLVTAVAGARVAPDMAVSDGHQAMEETPSMAHADCMGHDTAMQAASDMDPDYPSCTMCQTCHTVALSAPALLSLAAISLPHALPSAALPCFVSADCALCIKPPIS